MFIFCLFDVLQQEVLHITSRLMEMAKCYDLLVNCRHR